MLASISSIQLILKKRLELSSMKHMNHTIACAINAPNNIVLYTTTSKVCQIIPVIWLPNLSSITIIITSNIFVIHIGLLSANFVTSNQTFGNVSKNSKLYLLWIWLFFTSIILYRRFYISSSIPKNSCKWTILKLMLRFLNCESESSVWIEGVIYHLYGGWWLKKDSQECLISTMARLVV